MADRAMLFWMVHPDIARSQRRAVKWRGLEPRRSPHGIIWILM
jgi:hypothetical protein